MPRCRQPYRRPDSWAVPATYSTAAIAIPAAAVRINDRISRSMLQVDDRRCNPEVRSEVQRQQHVHAHRGSHDPACRRQQVHRQQARLERQPRDDQPCPHPCEACHDQRQQPRGRGGKRADRERSEGPCPGSVTVPEQEVHDRIRPDGEHRHARSLPADEEPEPLRDRGRVDGRGRPTRTSHRTARIPRSRARPSASGQRRGARAQLRSQMVRPRSRRARRLRSRSRRQPRGRSRTTGSDSRSGHPTTVCDLTRARRA